MNDFECLPVGTAARMKELEAEVERLRELGVGYSQQTMNAVVREREELRAEIERLRALNVELLEALKLAQQIIGHPDDAHSKLIAAAIAKVEASDE